ncbi:MAG: hypothetical protein Kow0069_14640 [Promethearchaeota archaeon]
MEKKRLKVVFVNVGAGGGWFEEEAFDSHEERVELERKNGVEGVGIVKRSLTLSGSTRAHVSVWIVGPVDDKAVDHATAFKGAAGLVIAFDVSDPVEWDGAQRLRTEFQQVEPAPVVFLATCPEEEGWQQQLRANDLDEIRSLFEGPDSTFSVVARGEAKAKLREALAALASASLERAKGHALAKAGKETAGDAVIEVATSGTRRKCPKCGNANSSMIRELRDETRVLSAYPLVYGRKYVCGACGATWRYVGDL